MSSAMAVAEPPELEDQEPTVEKTKVNRRAFTFSDQLAELLERLAKLRKVKDGDIVRDALLIYEYIVEAQIEAKKAGKRFAVLLDRGQGSPAEILVPKLPNH